MLCIFELYAVFGGRYWVVNGTTAPLANWLYSHLGPSKLCDSFDRVSPVSFVSVGIDFCRATV